MSDPTAVKPSSVAVAVLIDGQTVASAAVGTTEPRKTARALLTQMIEHIPGDDDAPKKTDPTL